MSNEKQTIEEMARIICKPTANKGNCDKCGFKKQCSKFDDATDLYNAGYRKQSGWISVDERLPERNGRYLTHCNIENQSLVCVLYYCKIGGFNEGTVTHWMPLPEAPKGGAE